MLIRLGLESLISCQIVVSKKEEPCNENRVILEEPCNEGRVVLEESCNEGRVVLGDNVI